MNKRSLPATPLPHCHTAERWRVSDDLEVQGRESQYLEGKLKLPAQSRPFLGQWHPNSALNTSPHSPCCRLQLEPEQTPPTGIIFKAQKEHGSMNYS